ncbi:MAG: arsenite methyltransferase [Bacteroidales bacterium]|nr:arsenite methyltransferase [Bacteroidales bacterium]
MDNETIKRAVQEKYATIARKAKSETSTCCNTGCCNENEAEKALSKLYTKLEGYVPEADLMLGCGIPTQYAGISEGNHVLDLGSGAGNDCFIVRAIVGINGKVTGIDFTPEMVAKAKENNLKLGYDNVEFILGDIENMPLPSNTYDVVISNCVLNLVPEKKKAFAEILRVLKPGGHFCVSDIVTNGDVPEKIRHDLELYAGCIAGAIDQNDYLEIIKELGFEKVTIHNQKPAIVPDELKKILLDSVEKISPNSIVSITISGYKPKE